VVEEKALPLLGAGDRVLDIGCGTGDFTAELAGLLPDTEVSGVDLFEEMVSHARRAYPAVQFTAADLTTARFDGDVDIATSFMALHWPGPDPYFVRGVKSLLRPGGVFCAGFPGVGSTQQGVEALETVMRTPELAAYFPRNPRLDEFPTMFHRERPHAWDELLRDQGFDRVSVGLVKYHTPYYSEEACFQRLIAAWPPILSPAYLPADRVAPFLRRAAAVMCSSSEEEQEASREGDDDDERQAPLAYMTSHLIEFTASLPPR